ncbi:MAG: hypothetical protein GTO40_11740 [Deltaproteobacteria bacterium]|nr:hypothetical protein [Deltaproteobacteria bacterium]
MSLKSSLFIAFLLVFAQACSTKSPTDTLRSQWLPFLEDGKTSRIVVLSRLGRPSSRLEKGRILTYRLQMDHQDILRPVSQGLEEFVIDRKLYGEHPMYSLVLIFDDNDVVRKHSLVEILP